MNIISKFFILLMCLCIIFSVSTVSAAEDDMGSNMLVDNVSLSDSLNTDVISCVDDSENKLNDVKSDEIFTFSDLADEIVKCNGTLNLKHNYTYNNTTDSAYEFGIIINNTLTINGNNYVINGNHNARIFDVNSNLELNQIIIINCFSSNNGGAISNYGNITIENLTIMDCYSNNDGGAISNYGNFIVNNLVISNCNSTIGGAILNNKNFDAVNLSIINCSATNYAPAIYNVQESVFNVVNLSIVNCSINCTYTIYNAGIFNVTNSTFNITYISKDGLLVLNECNVILSNSTFVQNYNYAIDAINSNFTVEYSTFDRVNPNFLLVWYLDCNCSLDNNYWSTNSTNSDEFISNELIWNTLNYVAPHNWVLMDINVQTYIVQNIYYNFTIALNKLCYDNGTCSKFEGIMPMYITTINDNYIIIYDGVGNYMYNTPTFSNFSVIAYSIFGNELARFNVKLPTEINAQNITFNAYSSKTLVITLKDINGVLLCNKNVIVNFNGKNYMLTTNNYGVAKVNLGATIAKTYIATITFKGDENYANSTKKITVVVKPVYVTINQIITAANYLKNYGKKYKNLPTTVKIGSFKCTIAQASYLMAAAFKYIVAKKSYATKIKVIYVKATTKNTKGEIKSYKKQYLKIINNLYLKGAKGSLPTTIKVNSRTVGFNQYTFAIAKIITFSKVKYKLPNYVVFSGTYKV